MTNMLGGGYLINNNKKSIYYLCATPFKKQITVQNVVRELVRSQTRKEKERKNKKNSAPPLGTD